MSGIERDPGCDGGFACLAPTHIEGCFTGEGHPDAIPAEVAELVVSLRQQLAGAVSFTADELHCLTCAMAGNFPARFTSIRMGLLRKLARASRDSGRQSGA